MSFHFKQFSITHQSEGLKVNTDGCLLGALSSADHPKSCLDIGTGTGVIALMLAQKYPDAKITAIELNENAFVQAKKNIDASKFKEQIELIHTDILDYTTLSKFDLIVCNPPYFSKHLKGTDAIKNMALHDETLPRKKLAEKVIELLNDNGLFWVIYPPAEMNQMETEALSSGLFITHKFTIENKAGRNYRSIIGFGKTKKSFVENSLLLTDKNGNRSHAFSAIMKDFYL